MRRLSWVALFALGALSLPVGPAWAQPAAVDEPSPEARAANEEALKRVGEGNYPEALELFQKAYDLSPSYVILYNVGRMSRLTGDMRRARAAFVRYLEEGGEGVGDERRAEVLAEIDALDKVVGKLTIEVDVDGATVTVDDEAVGTSPLSEVVIVNPGKRRVRATKEGEEPVEQELDVKGGASLTVKLKIEGGDGTTGPQTPGEPFELPGASAPGALVWGLWIGTAVFVVGAAATGTIALVESAKLEDSTYASQPGYGPPRDSDIIARRDRIHGLAVTTNWLIVGASVLGTAALYFTIAGATENEPPVAVGVGLDGLRLRGAF